MINALAKIAATGITRNKIKKNRTKKRREAVSGSRSDFKPLRNRFFLIVTIWINTPQRNKNRITDSHTRFRFRPRIGNIASTSNAATNSKPGIPCLSVVVVSDGGASVVKVAKLVPEGYLAGLLKASVTFTKYKYSVPAVRPVSSNVCVRDREELVSVVEGVPIP